MQRKRRLSCHVVAPALVAALLVAVVPVAAEDAEKPNPDTSQSLREALEGLALPDLDGKQVELVTLLGKGPVILDFWATWCKPCLIAIPELQQLYEDLAPRGLRVVGIN